MLLIRAVQVNNKDGVCAYEVTVFINAKPIWQGSVGKHTRSDGWAVLAGNIARKAGLQTKEQKRTIEESLKLMSGDAIHCPACDRILGYA